ncbi:sigma-54 interaction domain-containing protein [Peribacillus simplex]|uniref:sigma-54 interaction domain-containing protein n=1 Tax=Peribacillus simplex TaxID=1478 RepID=UPI0024C100D6|nr:sigma 54-interacting transcriptional regulator [Peribacillus simplex]WHY99715.1 sigma 54-interacting transcriptional regulator [Peribacillus simplex]
MNTGQFSNNKLLDIVFESTYYGIVIVDSNGKIQYISNKYCEFLNVERDTVIGEHVTNIIENTRLHLVVQIGKSEIADIHFLRGDFVIANRIPIIENNEIIGAIGTIMFRDLDDWNKMNSHIKEILTKHNFYRNEIDVTNGVKYSLHNLIGTSQEIQQLKERVKRLARGDISVLIRGESGTGKEIIAHSIHQLSGRSDKPLVKINCSSIPEHLLESELFGYEEGAFTGAKKGGKIGKFQFADGGTVFLDEIGDMPQQMQVKLLRVLQEKEFEPVGSLYPKKLNVRVIAATNRPLEKLVEEKLFREDLFYRINAVQLFVPPLRDRIEDIPILVDYFFKKITARIGKRVTSIHPEVISLIEQYNWPGNIRELENVIDAGVLLSNEEVMGKDALPDYLKLHNVNMKELSLKDCVEKTEKKEIEKALRRFKFDKKRVAEALGIGNSTLYDKIRKYKISDE